LQEEAEEILNFGLVTVEKFPDFIINITRLGLGLFFVTSFPWRPSTLEMRYILNIIMIMKKMMMMDVVYINL
jgi:hypothetical protein